MKGFGLMVGLLAAAGAGANAQACNGASCERFVVAAAANAFDGNWSETITGESASCAGTITTTFQIVNGRLVQQGSQGEVRANGSASGSAVGNGFTLTWTGHFSANSASGRYKRSDGCVGRWQAVKQ
jgi:hypothetical protein